MQATVKTIEPSPIPPEVFTNLEHAIARSMKGERDPEAMRLAAERINKTRAEIFQRVSLVNFAVPTIRERYDD